MCSLSGFALLFRPYKSGDWSFFCSENFFQMVGVWWTEDTVRVTIQQLNPHRLCTGRALSYMIISYTDVRRKKQHQMLCCFCIDVLLQKKKWFAGGKSDPLEEKVIHWRKSDALEKKVIHWRKKWSTEGKSDPLEEKVIHWRKKWFTGGKSDSLEKKWSIGGKSKTENEQYWPHNRARLRAGQMLT